MKACVRRGLTLVHVYGEFSMTWKVVTQLFRSAAYEKFDKVRAVCILCLCCSCCPGLFIDGTAVFQPFSGAAYKK
eukprot:scaffold105009_cov19-Tisochrysis_lutea.AAC.1